MNRIDRPKLECPSDSDTEDSDAEIQPAEAVAVDEVVQQRGHSSVPAEEVTRDDKEVIPEGSESSVSIEAGMSTNAGKDSEKQTVKDQEVLRRSKRNIQPPRRLIEEI